MSSDKWDRYARMGYVSATLVRHFHPDCRITLLVDEVTGKALNAPASPLLDVVDNTVAIETGLENAVARSRFVKTSMRRWITGDFVFLDVDAIPIAPFGDILNTEGAIAAALENNKQEKDRFFPHGLDELYARLQWTCPVPKYFNTGIVLLRDTPATHAACDEWHRRWLQSSEVGYLSDQPSFNSAMYESNIPIGILPSEYNAMVLFFPWRFRSCRIAHFFESNSVGGTLLSHLVKSVEQDRTIDWNAIEKCLAEGHPWEPECEPWQLWRSRNYVRAIVRKVKTAFGASKHKALQSS
ncbi:MAG: putative nucleotide-diphospho-sugar transferase [Gemmataceae bacterium]